MDSESRLGLDELNGNSETISINNSARGEESVAFNPSLSPQTHHSSPDHCDKHYHSKPIFAKEIYRASDLLMSVSVCAEVNKPRINDLAAAAVEELTQMAIAREPLWLQDIDTGSWVLNDVEYKKRFGPLDATLQEIIRMVKTEEPIQLPNLSPSNSSMGFKSKPLQTEASRESARVFMNPVNLAKMFMDVDQWSTMFSNIVSKATVLGVQSTGQPGNPNGALQVMTVEYHLPSPLSRCRESYFVRHCKQLASQSWIVVDASLGSIFPMPLIKCERRSSGCLIQEMEDGYSMVTWVENLEVDNRSVKELFRPIVSSGFAFGAKRWLATLAWQCERHATMMDESVKDLKEGRKSLLKLAGRMMRDYYASVRASPENPWRPLPITGAEDVMIMACENLDDPGSPRGVAITTATTIWLPVSPEKVFIFLQDGNARNQWDILSKGRATREMVRIGTGRDLGNCVSIVVVDHAPNNVKILYVQESCTNSTGSYVVYAPIDIPAMKMILDGGDPDRVQILASGFAIIPDRPAVHGKEITGGTLLTLSFQIMDDNLSTSEYLPSQSVSTLHNLVNETVNMIACAIMKLEAAQCRIW